MSLLEQIISENVELFQKYLSQTAKPPGANKVPNTIAKKVKKRGKKPRKGKKSQKKTQKMHCVFKIGQKSRSPSGVL
jgi:hypothetical protein